MKTIIVISTLIQLQAISINCLENRTDSNKLEDFRHKIIRNINSFDDVLEAVQSVENQTLEIQEETFDQNNAVQEVKVEVPTISTELAATEEEFYPTTTSATTATTTTTTTTTKTTTSTTKVLLNQDFTSNDESSFDRETKLRREPYNIVVSTKGYSTSTSSPTLRTVPETSPVAISSSGSWWLSNFWSVNRKEKGNSSVVVTTTPMSSSTTTTSTVIVTSTIQYLYPEDEQTTVFPTTFTEATQTTVFPSEKHQETVTATSVMSSSSSTTSTTSSSSSSSHTPEEATTLSSSTSAFQHTEAFTHTEVVFEVETETGLKTSPVQSLVEDSQRGISTEKALFLVAVIIPCLLLLLLLVWLYLRRRSVWGRGREKEMFRAVVVEEEGLMNNITSTATLKTLIPADLTPSGTRQSVIFLMPGQSLPNISMEVKGKRTRVTARVGG